MSDRRITILGMGPTAMERRLDMARYCEGTEIWTLNNAYTVFPHLVPQIARWFELHSWKGNRRQYLYDAAQPADDHFERLAALPCPVYTSEPLPCIRDQVTVPWVDVFTHHCRDSASNYFLGSPSLMVALALYEHDQGNEIAELRSWGIDTSDTRHAQQRQSWAYWMSQCHGRQIDLGGSAFAFAAETEGDPGLVGIREAVGKAVAARPFGELTTNYIVCTWATPDYMPHVERLRGECEAAGLKLAVHEIGPMDRAAVMREKPRAVEAALKLYEKPVLMIDADDHLLKAPAVTAADLADCDFGMVRNCEQDVMDTPLHLASCGAWYFPTEAGLRFVEQWRAYTDQTEGLEHRALHMAYYHLSLWIRSRDLTARMKGCISVTPRPGKDRPPCQT